MRYCVNAARAWLLFLMVFSAFVGLFGTVSLIDAYLGSFGLLVIGSLTFSAVLLAVRYVDKY